MRFDLHRMGRGARRIAKSGMRTERMKAEGRRKKSFEKLISERSPWERSDVDKARRVSAGSRESKLNSDI